MGARIKNKVRVLTYPQIIAFGYFTIIFVGALLLMLPVATVSREGLPFVDALFTATSATCVTGLVVRDTVQTFSFFGQAVLLLLIQIGGLGFMTVIAMFGFFFKKRIGLRARTLLKESVNSLSVGGIVRLFRKILFGTALFEGVGALLLATRFIPAYGFVKGLWYSVFHSISAFCNAGFDLMGADVAYNSLVDWAGDPVVCITIALLIMIGGIGFFVWGDVQEHRLHFKQYQLHTKVTLAITALLVVVGTVLYLICEWNNTFVGMSFGQKLLDAFFCAVTPRTAGFNVVDTAAFHTGARMLTIILMFIGGSSGGTAGGIKTTTLAVLVISAWDSLIGKKDTNVFGRRLEADALRRANAVCTINMVAIITATMLITLAEPHIAISDVIFEVTSALSTVGLTTGTTAASGTFARFVLIFMMYAGRVGSMSFALLFTEQKVQPSVRCPEEKLSIG